MMKKHKAKSPLLPEQLQPASWMNSVIATVGIQRTGKVLSGHPDMNRLSFRRNPETMLSEHFDPQDPFDGDSLLRSVCF